MTIVGNSMGGWITAEMALLGSPRISGIVLVDSIGIEVPGHPVADTSSLSTEQIMKLTFHDPARFSVDPAALPPAAQAVMAANQGALVTYTGGSRDPGLATRLSTPEMPTLVLWGDSDQVADADYGRPTRPPFQSPGSSSPLRVFVGTGPLAIATAGYQSRLA